MEGRIDVIFKFELSKNEARSVWQLRAAHKFCAQSISGDPVHSGVQGCAESDPLASETGTGVCICDTIAEGKLELMGCFLAQLIKVDFCRVKMASLRKHLNN